MDAIVTIDERGRIESVNPATERLFGYAAHEMVGRNVRMLMTGPDAARHDDHLARHLAGGEPRIIGIGREVVARRADGSSFPAHLAVGEMEVSGVRMFTGVVRDMTELHQAEREAARQRDYVLAMIESMQDGLVVRGLDGVIVQVNRRFCELVGFSSEELVGSLPPFPYWLPGAADPLDLLGTGGAEMELTFQRRDGSPIAVMITASPVDDPQGGSTTYVESVKDVTDRRAAERVLVAEAAQRQSEALLIAEREAQRLKDEFLAMVSHELRTPLSAVMGYLELAISDVADPDVRDLLLVAERNGRRLNALVRDILLVAQADAGRLGLDLRTVALGDLVSQAVAAARPSAAAKGIHLEKEIDVNPAMRADPDRLGQVLDNLISNAIKFSPSGGSVRVGLTAGAEHARITVSDDGPGIPADERERLFEPFYRARQATQDVVPGSGLGLAVAKAIAEAHGGTIAVESDLGRGSAFRADLPLAADAGDAAPVAVETTA